MANTQIQVEGFSGKPAEPDYVTVLVLYAGIILAPVTGQTVASVTC